MADLARSVSDDERVTTPNTTWQRVALDIADRIRNGETPIGSKIASYQQLADRNSASFGTVKRAIEHLRDTGILQGAQGSGVFVLRVPDKELDFTAPSPDELAGRVARVEDALGKLAAENTDLREIVGLLQAHLIELYARLGQPYPHGNGVADQRTKKRPQRRAADG